VLGPLLADEACAAQLSEERSLLGSEQFEWLTQGLLESTANVKFVANDVQLSFIGLLPYDGWDGYDAERRALLEFIDAHGIEGVVFLTTNFHASWYNPDVTRYFRRQRPDYDLPNEVPVVEAIVGPLGFETLHETAIGTATGVLGAGVAAWLLDRCEFPQGYMLCFGSGAVLIFISWLFLLLTREPARTNPAPPISQREYWRRLPSVLRGDPNFGRYLLSQVVVALGGMAGGFVAVYAVQRWDLPDSQAGSLTAAMLVGQAAANLLFGTLADRQGHKRVLELSALVGALAIGLASVAPAPAWFYVVFALNGAALAGFMLSGLVIAFEFAPPGMRPTYIGLNNTAYGIVASVAPILGGWVAGRVGYQVLFAMACVVGLVGFALLHWSVREPRHARATAEVEA